MSQFSAPLPFGQQPDVSPLRQNFAPRMGGPDTSLNQQELEENRAIQQRTTANMLQNAQALQVAKGQSVTRGGGNGVSPITQSILKAKALATSSLDTDNLTPQQKQLLDESSKDPNIDYRTHLSNIEQIRAGQHQQTQQSDFNTRQQATNSHFQMNQQRQAANTQRKGIEQQMTQLEAPFKQQYLDIDGEPVPGETADMQAARKQYAALKQQHEALVEGAFSDQGEQPAGGKGDEADQKGAEYSPAMAAAGYGSGPGQAQVIVTHQQQQPANNPQQQQSSDSVWGEAKPGSRGKATAQVVHYYADQLGNDPNKIRAAMKKDGWSW